MVGIIWKFGMMNTKVLQKIIDELDYMKEDYPNDGYVLGYNSGLDKAIGLIREKLATIENLGL